LRTDAKEDFLPDTVLVVWGRNVFWWKPVQKPGGKVWVQDHQGFIDGRCRMMFRLKRPQVKTSSSPVDLGNELIA